MKNIFLIVFISSFITFCGISQESYHKQVNEEVWTKFYKAFEKLDAELMAEIHSEDLLRIPASSGRILGYDEYINNYRNNFKSRKEAGGKSQIELRFFERINNGKAASERGIYKLTVTNKSGETKSYYGQFHVILRNQNEEWKIIMDYDSNEGGTIDEKKFNNAKSIDDFNL
ncbi:YybH family protein [Mangrovivirga cuniculi]|uniref:DUF4440 domain-containing protein n=1 Tax=Mangrovivirga cuniculi TaxID=2715131 RepID=A0A4D7JJ91_9BACT|nr:nuclear transport factor 2 family protein [Mangrovivirga cuniculi]QCK15661.1 hypothetical protein DCC35_13370 [Mangrovivirga cuniculi]